MEPLSALGRFDALRRLRCRAMSHPLGPGPHPAQVLRRASGSDGLVALIGEWAGGGALIASEPLIVAGGTATDVAAALTVQPAGIDRGDVVGGGWFGHLSFSGPSRLAFYDHLLRWRGGEWFFEALWSDARDALLQARREEFAALLEGPDASSTFAVGEFGGASMPAHLVAVERAIEWIRAGEIYQANVCTRLAASFSGDPVALFADAAQRLSPRFGAYVDAGDRQVASLSPELFLRRRGRTVETAPIKGTWPRTEEGGAAALRRSAKDVAENVMIVDLMRNDLGRVCDIGTVRPSSLLQIEAHPGVWHLVSTVTGELRRDVDDAELIAATFPPGSVTGAPKLRALDAIAAVEAAARGAYTGAVGFASPSWGLQLAVAIRTFEIGAGRIALGVGGGVTADSVPVLEWRECLHKAAPLLAAASATLAPDLATSVTVPDAALVAGGLLETVLVINGKPVRLAAHLARLDRSCRELYGAGLPTDAATRARSAAAAATQGRAALRVVAGADLNLSLTCAPLGAPAGVTDVRVVRGRSGSWRHKWADRSYLSATEADVRAPLFVAADGAVLETSRGNVFLLREDGCLVTPPLREDLLPGVTRRALLDLARDQGRRTVLRTFDVHELRANVAFWTSSVSGAVAIRSVDGDALPEREAEIAQLAMALTVAR